MVEIVHRTRTGEVAGSGKGLFLLTDKRGGYCLLGDNAFSHFCGLFSFLPGEWTQFKTVDDIRLDRPPERVINRFYSVVRECGVAREEFFMFNKALYYEVRGYRGEIVLDLDMRRVYDSPGMGRAYKIYWEDGCVVVEYSCEGSGQVFFLVIRGTDHYLLRNRWSERFYAYDAARGERESRWVYEALRFDCPGDQRLTFTFGVSKERAMRDACDAFDEWDLSRSRLSRYANTLPTGDDVSLSAALFSLESLVMSLNDGVDRTGLYAGLPWFFHFWSRDELISLHGLVLGEKYALAKEILMRYAGGLEADGRLPNRLPAAGLGSADAVGWLWKRFGDLLRHLDDRRLLWQYFSADELSWVVDRLEFSLRSLRECHVVDGLVTNAAQETWMDTHGGVGDVRKGARVEVQALTLASLQTLFLLYRLLRRGNGREFRDFERSLVRRVREVLFRDGSLCDGFDGSLDATQRPNVFIAYYAFPSLFSRQEWVGIFDRALSGLWLDWGGLASIDKGHALFVDEYAVRDDRSYHRGDSWYWVNNLAAIAMHALDQNRYRFHVHAIRDASVRELLWGGVLGHHAEVSSARVQGSEGSLSQAWSSALLVELLLQMR